MHTFVTLHFAVACSVWRVLRLSKLFAKFVLLIKFDTMTSVTAKKYPKKKSGDYEYIRPSKRGGDKRTAMPSNQDVSTTEPVTDRYLLMSEKAVPPEVFKKQHHEEERKEKHEEERKEKTKKQRKGGQCGKIVALSVGFLMVIAAVAAAVVLVMVLDDPSPPKNTSKPAIIISASPTLKTSNLGSSEQITSSTSTSSTPPTPTPTLPKKIKSTTIPISTVLSAANVSTVTV